MAHPMPLEVPGLFAVAEKQRLDCSERHRIDELNKPLPGARKKSTKGALVHTAQLDGTPMEPGWNGDSTSVELRALPEAKKSR